MAEIFNKDVNVIGKLSITGSLGVGTESPTETLEVVGKIEAHGYINSRESIRSNQSDKNPSTTAFDNLSFNTGTFQSEGYLNALTVAYAGRVRKIVIKNTSTGSVPTNTSTVIRVVVNGTTSFTSSAVVNTAAFGMSVIVTLGDSDALFAAGDLIRIQYQTDAPLQDIAAVTILEYTE